MYEVEKLLNKDCIYIDYLGDSRLGRVVSVENYTSTNGEAVQLCYIFDQTDDRYNDKMDTVNGILVRYADIRNSYEISLFDEDED